MSEQLPRGDYPRRRSSAWQIVGTLLAVAVGGAGLAVLTGAVKAPTVAIGKPAATPTISPGCQPQTLWLAWRVERDTSSPTTTRLYHDIDRLERRLANDPRRFKFMAVIRDVKADTVAGIHNPHSQDFAEAVRSEPRC